MEQHILMTGVPALGAALAAVLLAACASQRPQDYSFADGWRRGKVESIVAGAELRRPQFWNCTRGRGAALRNRTYAIVSYEQVPQRNRRHLVQLPAGSQLAAGDKVYVNLSACEHAIVERDARSDVRQRGARKP